MEVLHLLQHLFRDMAQPFASWNNFVFAVSGGVRAITSQTSKTGWPYLLSSLLIAWVIFRRTRHIHGQRSFFAFMFPREIYGHPSAIADYKFVAFELSSRLLFTAPFISAVSYAFYKGLRYILPSVRGHWITNPAVRGLLATVASVVVADFVFFAAHYLLHKIPILWKFHEVHHSAEVLTPVTVYRVHPIEDLLNGIVGALVGAIIGIFYTGAFDREAGVTTFFGVNVIVLAFFLFGNVLRHSHVWLSYGPFLSRVFISPAQHQIHHSSAQKHWDKNFGYILAIWDWLFRTLYVPTYREDLVFGVPGFDAQDYATVPRLYFLPFAKAGRLCWSALRDLRRRLSPYGGSTLDGSSSLLSVSTSRMASKQDKAALAGKS